MNIDDLVRLVQAGNSTEDPGVLGALLGLILENRSCSKEDKLQQIQVADFQQMMLLEGIENILAPDPFVRLTADIPGDVILGRAIQTGHFVAIYEHEAVQHILILARSGGGKTTLILAITIPLMERGKKVLYFDQKRDFIHLARRGVWVFRVGKGDLKWNPLEPPERLSPRTWAGIISYVFSQSYGFIGGMATENYLLISLINLYEMFEAQGAYPCPLDLAEYLRARPVPRMSPIYQSYERLMNRLAAINEAIGDTVNCSSGFKLSQLLGNNVVLDLAGMKPDMQAFLTEALLTAMLMQRIASGERHGLENILVFDEAKRLLPRYRETYQQGISNMSILISQVREFGAGIIAAEMEPELLANSLSSNTYTRVCMSLSNGKDIQDASLSLGLSREQQQVIYQLNPGEAIVRLAGRCPDPLLIRVDPYEEDKSISDNEIERRMAPVLRSLEWTPRAHIGAGRVARGAAGDRKSNGEDAGERAEAEERPKKEKNGSVWQGISKDGIDLLIDIANDPFIGVAQRSSKLGLSASKADSLHHQLISAGLAEKVVINTHRRGGLVTLLRVTDDGYSLLESLKVRVNKPPGKGNFTHAYFQDIVFRWAVAQGWEAQVEKFVNGKAVDVAVEMNGRRCAFEVVNQKWEKEVSNYSKDIFVGFDEIVFCCADRETIKKLSEKITALFGEESKGKVSFRLLASFAEGM
jgi:hypothetical protein